MATGWSMASRAGRYSFHIYVRPVAGLPNLPMASVASRLSTASFYSACLSVSIPRRLLTALDPSLDSLDPIYSVYSAPFCL